MWWFFGRDHIVTLDIEASDVGEVLFGEGVLALVLVARAPGQVSEASSVGPVAARDGIPGLLL